MQKCCNDKQPSQSYSSSRSTLYLQKSSDQTQTTSSSNFIPQSPLSVGPGPPPTAGTDALESAAMSTSENIKSNRSMSSLMCLGLLLFGITGIPCCTNQRNAT